MYLVYICCEYRDKLKILAYIVRRDKLKRVPYALAKDKETRNVFRKFRGIHPDRYL